MQPVEWKAVRKTFAQTLAGFTALAALVSFYFWGLFGAIVTLCAALYVLAGFWLSETLVGLMVRVKNLSPISAIFVFTAKLLWWGALFLLMKQTPAEAQIPIALGIGSFLFSLLAAVLSHAWMPNLSGDSGKSKP